MWNQPISSPMIMMMLGFCCAAAIPASSSTVATVATTVHARRLDTPALLLIAFLLSLCAHWLDAPSKAAAQTRPRALVSILLLVPMREGGRTSQPAAVQGGSC